MPAFFPAVGCGSGIPLLWAWAQPFFHLGPQQLSDCLSLCRSPGFLAQCSLGLHAVISDCILALWLEQPQLCPPPGFPGRGHPASGGVSVPQPEGNPMGWLFSDESLTA